MQSNASYREVSCIITGVPSTFLCPGVSSTFLWKKLRKQGNYQTHHSKCTFYINFVLIFKGIRYIYLQIYLSL